MNRIEEPQETLLHQSRIAVPYTWSAGVVGSRFLKALAEQQKFLASRCPKCRKVFLPPLKTCNACFKECEQEITVGPRGTLLSFTQSSYNSPAHPCPRPLYGLIRLDGADTAFLHLLRETSLEELKTGMRVEPVFHETPSRAFADLLHFKPVP